MIIEKSQAEIYLNECYPGMTLGPKIGHGATASVFELPGYMPPQVIKIMDTEAMAAIEATREHRMNMHRRFRQEAEVMLRMRSCRQIVTMYDYAEYRSPEDRRQIPQYSSYKSVFLLRMERLRGMRECLRETGLSERELVRMGMDICLALQCCEDNGILHRDVKPENIFIRPEGGQKRFVLGDFGFCREFDEADIRQLTQCGTQAYQAPELLLRTVKPGMYNSDIFSLGTTLFTLASGGLFPDYTEQNDGNLSVLGKLNEEFAKVILQAVAQDPDRRQQHARDMYRQLEKLLPHASSEIVAGNHYLLTKQLMLNGKYDEAIEEARAGIRKQENDCKRLLAYCMYNQSQHILTKEKDPTLRSAAERRIETAEKLLNQLVYECDANAQYIRAQVAIGRNDWDKFIADLTEAAQEGSVLAAYRYGRALYAGERMPRKPKEGFELLRKAAEAGYLEALRIVVRIAKMDPNTAGSYAQLYRGLCVELTPRQKQEQLVKYL